MDSPLPVEESRGSIPLTEVFHPPYPCWVVKYVDPLRGPYQIEAVSAVGMHHCLYVVSDGDAPAFFADDIFTSEESAEAACAEANVADANFLESMDIDEEKEE